MCKELGLPTAARFESTPDCPWACRFDLGVHNRGCLWLYRNGVLHCSAWSTRTGLLSRTACSFSCCRCSRFVSRLGPGGRQCQQIESPRPE